MDHVFQDEYPFRFIDDPVSLATLASTELSLSLWRQKFSNGEKTALEVLQTNFSCTEFFTVPSRIKNIIDGTIISVGEELEKWIKFVSKHNVELQSAFLANLDDVVFDPNGRISYSKTGAKTIMKDDIRRDIKFKIACLFCLEDEVERLWLTMKRSSEFDKSCSVKKTRMLHYWYCVMSSARDSILIKNRVWNESRRQNWASLRYFWQRLNDELKLPMASKIFKQNDTEAMMCLLPKLNESEAREIFGAKTCEIMSILLSNHEYVEHVFALWTRMGNVVSEKVFLQLIQGMWRITWNVPRADNMQRYKVDGILVEIWSWASPQLRSHVLAHSAEFFNGLQLHLPGFVFNYGHNMEFLLNLLRNNTAEFRNTVWLENWRKIVVRAKPSYLRQFLELCLPDDEAIDDFKSGNLLKFNLMYTLLIKHGYYSDLTDYLEFCSKPDTSIKKINQRILISNMGGIVFTLLNGNNFEKFSSFVDGLFSDTDSAAKFKQKLLFSAKSVKSLLTMFNKGRLKDCQQIISRLAVSEENLQEMKSKFLNHSRKYLTTFQTMEFNVTEWEELVKWCTRNEEEIAAFKKSLNINEIFQYLLKTYAYKSWFSRSQRLMGRLFFYDCFSKWYFDDEQAERDFKLEKMNTYYKIGAIRELLAERPRQNAIKMVYWAFEYDRPKVLEFQQRLIRDQFWAAPMSDSDD